MRRVVATKILRCVKGCNALLLPVESLVIATHQSLVNTVATLGGIAPFESRIALVYQIRNRDLWSLASRSGLIRAGILFQGLGKMLCLLPLVRLQLNPRYVSACFHLPGGTRAGKTSFFDISFYICFYRNAVLVGGPAGGP